MKGIMIGYRVVYDLMVDGYQDWPPAAISLAISLIFILIFLINKFLFRRLSASKLYISVFGSVFCLLFSIITFFQSYGVYQEAVHKINSGSFYVVEGVVSQFYAAGLGKGQLTVEKFVINSETFSYSDTPRLGFHTTKPYGGPLDEGVKARISYIIIDSKKIISKLEIKK